MMVGLRVQRTVEINVSEIFCLPSKVKIPNGYFILNVFKGSGDPFNDLGCRRCRVGVPLYDLSPLKRIDQNLQGLRICKGRVRGRSVFSPDVKGMTSVF